ncbi:hypothetical protein VIGAN_02261300 [Vigna angularis var. angularis]|uniref:Uncharacterized protein n=1 Tax=Vigna angularis var. angularis TaxID=157739 RepID=A0A0S3RGA1_PHAAN|nr:hypothetical protein VIGAN_02261300 [Vigna angularis var. angularis]
MVRVMHREEDSFQQHQNRMTMKPEKKEMKKAVFIRPPSLSSPTTPPVELYGDEEGDEVPLEQALEGDDVVA